jgi:hypothetical protein
MRQWWRNEPMDVSVSGTAQFEGRTAEEAVARAREALGESGALRCWKTRRGGVGGFFAREVFVASLTPPPGSEPPRGRASRAEPGKANRVRRRSPVVDGTKATSVPGPVRQQPQDQTIGPEDHLFGLVEATSDQVSLGSLAIPDEAFDEVLAEAEATLARETEGAPPSTAIPTPQATVTDQAGVDQPLAPADELAEGGPDPTADAGVRLPELPEGNHLAHESAALPATAGPARKTPGPKPKAARKPPTRRQTTAGKAQPHDRPAQIPDLRLGLRGLGVPDSYLPRGRRPSLDQLAGALATLPTPPSLPTRAGAVVAIVGSDSDAERTLGVVVQQLSLGRRDVIRPVGQAQAEADRLGRQIARRRAGGRTSLVAVRAVPGVPLPPEASDLLEQAAPDYVLAAVGAHCKRVDVEHWINGLPAVHALALWDLSGTRTPAELLGLLPVAFVDGRPSSSLGWTLALATRAMEGGR